MARDIETKYLWQNLHKVLVSKYHYKYIKIVGQSYTASRIFLDSAHLK